METTKPKSKRGWPKGRPRINRTRTQSVGIWSWSRENLLDKIQVGAEEDCWTWLGSQGPSGNLFGAAKNSRPQMTQANRVIYMDRTGLDLENQQVRMRCGNKFCCNHNHFDVKPHHRTDPYDWLKI